jgi:hypothetical protein
LDSRGAVIRGRPNNAKTIMQARAPDIRKIHFLVFPRLKSLAINFPPAEKFDQIPRPKV